mmetsp:Transcript_68017/g.146669  ORF Transcript_68017/g.146669 Transcript_68017/m.146669 type:complete len:960 (-) Transcript_68017:7888-10767(-)
MAEDRAEEGAPLDTLLVRPLGILEPLVLRQDLLRQVVEQLDRRGLAGRDGGHHLVLVAHVLPLHVQHRRCRKGRADALAKHEGDEALELGAAREVVALHRQPSGHHLVGALSCAGDALDHNLLQGVEVFQELPRQVLRLQRQAEGGDDRGELQGREVHHDVCFAEEEHDLVPVDGLHGRVEELRQLHDEAGGGDATDLRRLLPLQVGHGLAGDAGEDRAEGGRGAQPVRTALGRVGLLAECHGVGVDLTLLLAPLDARGRLLRPQGGPAPQRPLVHLRREHEDGVRVGRVRLLLVLARIVARRGVLVGEEGRDQPERPRPRVGVAGVLGPGHHLGEVLGGEEALVRRRVRLQGTPARQKLPQELAVRMPFHHVLDVHDRVLGHDRDAQGKRQRRNEQPQDVAELPHVPDAEGSVHGRAHELREPLICHDAAVQRVDLTEAADDAQAVVLQHRVPVPAPDVQEERVQHAHPPHLQILQRPLRGQVRQQHRVERPEALGRADARDEAHTALLLEDGPPPAVDLLEHRDAGGHELPLGHVPVDLRELQQPRGDGPGDHLGVQQRGRLGGLGLGLRGRILAESVTQEGLTHDLLVLRVRQAHGHAEADHALLDERHLHVLVGVPREPGDELHGKNERGVGGLLHRFGLPQRPDVLAVVRDELRPVAHDKAAPDALRAQLHRVQVVELPQDVEDHALGRDQVGVLLPALRQLHVGGLGPPDRGGGVELRARLRRHPLAEPRHVPARPDPVQELPLTLRDEGVEEGHHGGDEVGLELAHGHQRGEQRLGAELVRTPHRAPPRLDALVDGAEDEAPQILRRARLQLGARGQVQQALERGGLEDLRDLVDLVEGRAEGLQPPLHQLAAAGLARARQAHELRDVPEVDERVDHLDRPLLGQRHEQLRELQDALRARGGTPHALHEVVQDGQLVHEGLVAAVRRHRHQNSPDAGGDVVERPGDHAHEAV